MCVCDNRNKLRNCVESISFPFCFWAGKSCKAVVSWKFSLDEQLLIAVSGQPRRSFQAPVLAVDYDQLLGFPYSGEASNVVLKFCVPCAIGRRRIC